MSNRLARRFGTYLVVGALAAAAWNGYLALAGPPKIDDSLAKQLVDRNRVDMIVQLGFAPEQVHIKIFQEYGAVVGVKGNELTLLRVSTKDVPRIARYYWVKRLTATRPQSESK